MSNRRILDGIDNNFNLLRLFAATAVVLSHSYTITSGDSTSEPLRDFLGFSLGHVAVDIFFITSGFLITSSLFRRGTIHEFLLARALRVFPGLWAMLLITVFLIGPIVTKVSLSKYFTETETYRYLLQNSVLIFGAYFNLPGVFEGTPFPKAVNGSLWSLPIEIRMYILLAGVWFLLGLIKQQRTEKVKAIAWLVVFFCLLMAFYQKNTTDAVSHGVRLTAFFFCGTLLQTYKEKIQISDRLLLIALLTIFCSSLLPKAYLQISYSIVLPYLVIHFAYCNSTIINKLRTKDDISYGLYIYSFPIQQILISEFPDSQPVSLFFLSMGFTAAISFVSWRLIESKLIRFKIGSPPQPYPIGLNPPPLQQTHNY